MFMKVKTLLTTLLIMMFAIHSAFASGYAVYSGKLESDAAIGGRNFRETFDYIQMTVTILDKTRAKIEFKEKLRGQGFSNIIFEPVTEFDYRFDEKKLKLIVGGQMVFTIEDNCIIPHHPALYGKLYKVSQGDDIFTFAYKEKTQKSNIVKKEYFDVYCFTEKYDENGNKIEHIMFNCKAYQQIRFNSHGDTLDVYDYDYKQEVPFYSHHV